MSGIQTGTRLDRLTDLRRRITLRIEHAHQHAEPTNELHQLAAAVDHEIRAEGGTPPTGPRWITAPRARRPPAPHRTDLLLTDLGVTTATVRAWAVQHGLLDGVRRGRIAYAVVEAYATHHRKDTAP